MTATPLRVTIQYWAQNVATTPAFDVANFLAFLGRLTQTFPSYECDLEAVEQSGFNMCGQNRTDQLPVVKVSYTTPRGWNSSTDDQTLRETFNNFWPNQTCFSFKNEGPSTPNISIPSIPIQPAHMDSVSSCMETKYDINAKEVKTGPSQALYITLKTWKMAGPVITKDNLDKIAGKVNSAVTRHCLPYDVIFQAKQDDGFCKLLVKDAQKGTPVVQAMLEVDHGCRIEASFDKEVYGILAEFFPRPGFYVHVIRK